VRLLERADKQTLEINIDESFLSGDSGLQRPESRR